MNRVAYPGLPDSQPVFPKKRHKKSSIYAGFLLASLLLYNKSMSVLILKNIVTEGPGTIEDFLLDNGVEFRIIELSEEDIPQTVDADTLVILGGPMSVKDVDKYPYIAREIELAREFIDKGRKVFGICLGAQIMARALGAGVYPGPESEIGWYEIEISEDAAGDPMLRRLAVGPASGELQTRFRVFHLHGETFDVPAGAVRLARSALYPNQAFKYGRNAYAFQFHIEVKKEMIYDWLKDEPVDMGMVEKETEAGYDEYSGRAKNFYRAFFLNRADQP